MTRTKLVAALLALLVGGGAALVIFSNTASASDWHDYSGDLFAGHAYGMQVPAGADLLEIALKGASTSVSKLAIFDPTGAKVGYYLLDASLQNAQVSSPKEGRYVVYVYELDGALNLRVQAGAAPADAQLQQIDLKRQDKAIGTFDRAEKLDKTIPVTFASAPVFATLLYDGSAKNLEGTVASTSGPIATITGETATAFSPGVWTSYSGKRTSEPANLDGVVYKVTLAADSFEGHLVLTSLVVDFSTPAPKHTGSAPSGSHHNETQRAPRNHTTSREDTPVILGSSNVFGLKEGTAIAFQAPAGTLALSDPRAKASGHNASHESGDDSSYESYSDQIVIYTPDDRVLGVVNLRGDDASETLALPIAGEYVAYVARATNEIVLAQIDGTSAPPTVRELSLATESFQFQPSDIALPFLGGQSSEFTLTHVPVALKLDVNQTNADLLGDISVGNEKGTVASWSDLASVGGIGSQWIAGSYYAPQNFRAGVHHFTTSGTMGGNAKLVVTHYERSASADVPTAETPAAPAAPASGGIAGLPI